VKDFLIAFRKSARSVHGCPSLEDDAYEMCTSVQVKNKPPSGER
jgi:hypothetical protein